VVVTGEKEEREGRKEGRKGREVVTEGKHGRW
jgi:hypothetical protein